MRLLTIVSPPHTHTHTYMHAEAVVMFAPDEAVNGQVVVKSLATGEQITHETGDIVAGVLNILRTPVSL